MNYTPSEDNESEQAGKMDLASKSSGGPSTSNASHFLKKSEQMPKRNANHGRVSPCEPISVGPGFQNNSTSIHKSPSDFKRMEAAMSNGTNPCPLLSPRIFMATDHLTGATSSPSTTHQGWSIHSEVADSTSAPLKPHTGGDVRWDAISFASSKEYPLGLSNFRLLKRLGYGDIESVYLVELRGINAFFAMIVMDKGSLVNRNKLLWAQTEREIFSLLDHPFL